MLARLFDDPDEEVVRQAIAVLRHLPIDSLELVRKLITVAAESSAFITVPGSIILAADRYHHLIPEVALDIAGRFIDLYADQASNISSGSSHNASTLSKVVISVYAQSVDNDQLSTRALDLIDQFVIARTFSIDAHLSQLDR